MLCEWLAITKYNFHTSMAQKPTPHCLHRDNGCALLEERVSADVIEGEGKNAWYCTVFISGLKFGGCALAVMASL
jgi:hypothetical protein